MRWRRSAVWRRDALLSSTCVAGLVACAGHAATEGRLETVGADLEGEPGSSCDALLAELRSQVLATVGEHAAEARGWALPNSTGLFADAAPSFVEAAPSPPAPSLVDAAPARPTPAPEPRWSHPEGVPGVETADAVKAEGDRIYFVAGKTLYVVNAWPAETMTLVASLPIEGETGELFVRDGKVLVLSRVYGLPDGEVTFDVPYFWEPSFLVLTLLETAGDTPEVLRQIYIESEFDHGAASRADGVVHGVVQQGFRARVDYPDVRAGDIFGHPRSAAEADEQIALWVRQTTRDIEVSSIDDYLPISMERVGGQLVQQPRSCPEPLLAAPIEPGAGVTRIFSFDVQAADAPLESVSLLGASDGFYLDAESLILHQNVYGDSLGAEHTNIHRFDVDGTRVRRSASGSAPGYLPSGISLSQADGVIRLLLSEPVIFPTPGVEGSFEYPGNDLDLVTLGTREGQLTELSRLRVSGYDRYLQSSHFEPDRAYLSLGASSPPDTLLSVIDLSDPASPLVTAELPLEGDVSLLTELSDHRLLGVGQAPDEAGQSTLALRMLDVSEPAAPRLVARYVYPEPVYSNAIFDPSLLAIHPDRDLFTLLVQDAVSNQARLGVFRVNASTGFELLGHILPRLPEPTPEECVALLGYEGDPGSITDPAFYASLLEQCRAYTQPYTIAGVLRTDTVYALSNLDIGAYTLDALSGPPLGQIVFR